MNDHSAYSLQFADPRKQTPVPFLNIFDLKMVDDHMMGLEYMMYNNGSVDRKDEEELVVGSGS